LAVFVGGCALLRAAGLRGWALAPLGLLAGTWLQVAIAAVQAVTFSPTSQALTQVLVVALPAAWWVIRWRHGRDIGVRVSVVVFSLLALSAAVGALRSVTPLVELATLAALVWLFTLGGRDLIGPGRMALLGGLGALVLATYDRYAFGLFGDGYAAQLLLVVGCGWLLARDHRVRTLRVLQLVAIPALVLAGPGAFLVAALALLPTWLSATIPARHRANTLLICGGTTVIWHVYLGVLAMSQGTSPSGQVVGGVAVGALVLLLIPIRRWPFPLKRASSVLRLVEGALWLALVAFAIRDPDTVWPNHGNGWWEYPLGLLVLVALVGFPFRHRTFLRFPLTTVVPLAFLLGFADSPSRTLMQYAPLALLFVLAAYGTSPRSWGGQPASGFWPERADSSRVAMATAGTGEPAR
jgi:hypothetical protein